MNFLADIFNWPKDILTCFFKHAYPAFKNNVISILITAAWFGVLQYFAGLLSQLKMASGQRLPTIWCDLMPQLNLKSYITNAILIRTTLEGIISRHEYVLLDLRML